MKWYKHISDSLDDPFIYELIEEFGGDGYMVFFGVLEIYSREFSTENGWKLVVKLSYFHQKLLISSSKIKKILLKIYKWEISFTGDYVSIYIPKFRDLLDEWTVRKLNNHQKDSGVARELLVPKDTDTDTDTDIYIPPISPLKRGKRKSTKEEFALPDYIPQETWEAYLDTRRKKRAAQTPYAFNLVIKELERIRDEIGHNPVDVLHQSIKSGWTDVYPLKDHPAQQKASSW